MKRGDKVIAPGLGVVTIFSINAEYRQALVDIGKNTVTTVGLKFLKPLTGKIKLSRRTR